MKIEQFGPQHATAVAALHIASLRGLLTQLGARAARAYYTGCAASPLATGFVAWDGRVGGFVLGSTRPHALKRDVLQREPLGTATGVAAGVLRDPRALVSLIRTFTGPDSGHYDATAPELTYLAVAPQQRGRGVGRQLVQAFGDAMTAAGETRFELSVDASNRDAAAFYERLGFTRLGEYDEFGERHVRYELRLSPRTAAP